MLYYILCAELKTVFKESLLYWLGPAMSKISVEFMKKCSSKKTKQNWSFLGCFEMRTFLQKIPEKLKAKANKRSFI